MNRPEIIFRFLAFSSSLQTSERLTRGQVDKLDNVEAYHVESFGCRANQSEGEAIAAELRSRGLPPGLNPESAGLVILNTCSVTAEADRTARAFIRRVRRHNPQARIVVTGCYAQRAAEEIASLQGVDAVIGNSHKALVPRIAADLVANSGESSERWENLVQISRLTHPSAPITLDETFAHSELAMLPFAADGGRTRPNLKIQDGCGNRCSFCIIPTTRGPSRSVLLETCLENVRHFTRNGGKELVLSGINLGHWGRDLRLKPARNFVDLVEAILRQTSLPRLRLSSIEPMDWTSPLLALFREFARGSHPRLAPHAHLPLQSGSDTILRKMHRRYRPWHYAERTGAIRAALPVAAMGADVMVGFPGETDALFEESYNFIAAQPFTYLHLFPFSARPGTPGWELHRGQPTPQEVIAERMAALRSLADEKAGAFLGRFAGQSLSVVTLEGGSKTWTPALSANFLKVNLYGAFPPNQMLEAEVAPGLKEAALNGRVIPKPETALLHRNKQKQDILSSYMASEPCILEEAHR
ncbi:MAG TPA: MiaB/RimO family radical SAM methylthiotransferase [Silvibacterium sp.]|nr:MiaB/RimO family radical SAM methylthiotransferase [Silvibacterium sp.]